MADYTTISDRSIPVLREFPLTDLSVGHTCMTAEGILSVAWPNLQNLGVAGINFSDSSIASLFRSPDLTVVNANGSHLKRDAVYELASLPQMAVLEADTADVSSIEARGLSMRYPKMMFRFNDGIWRDGNLINPHRNGH